MANNNPIRTGRHALWELSAHLVFVTKYRSNVFTADILETCHQAMRKVCDDFEVTLEEFNGDHDHVHLLIRFPATIAISKLVNSLKGVSSRIIRRDHPEIADRVHKNHLWSRSYYAGTTGGANLETVKRYIQNQ